MIILLIEADGRLRDPLEAATASHGISVVQYNSPLKALDNLQEIRPQSVVYAWEDFPRHWKTMLPVIREHWSREDCAFILYYEDQKPEVEQVNQALHLGVNAFIPKEGSLESFVERLLVVYRRYGLWIPGQGRQLPSGSLDSPWTMAFNHPYRHTLVTGLLTQIDNSCATFKTNDRHLIQDLLPGSLIKDVSLQCGEIFIDLDVQVRDNTGQLLLDYVRINRDDREILRKLLNQV